MSFRGAGSLAPRLALFQSLVEEAEQRRYRHAESPSMELKHWQAALPTALEILIGELVGQIPTDPQHSRGLFYGESRASREVLLAHS
jgi:hypothetical protein